MSWRPIALLLITFLAYIPAWNAGFVWDDSDYVLHNSYLRTVDGLGPIWFQPGATPQYYPLVFTTFWAEYRLWGHDANGLPYPTGYHVVNVLLHAVNACLLWLVLKRLQIPGAWLIAAIFAVHPVHVESVAWITERKNVLSGMFYLLAFLAYMNFSPPIPQTAGSGPVRWGWYGVSLLCFLAALLSKTVTCSLPAVLLLVYWWKRGLPTRSEILALVPMFVLGAAMSMLTAWVEHEIVGARGPGWNFTFIERCLIAGRALWFYTGKLFWPYPLMFNYPRWHIDVAAPWQYLFPLGAIAALLILALPLTQRWLGRGPLVACLIFAGTLYPALGFVNVYPMKFYFVADHFQYLASIALIALAAAGFARLFEAGNAQISPSPPGTPGGEGRGEGGQNAPEKRDDSPALNPLTPTPLPRSTGREGKGNKRTLLGIGAAGLLVALGFLTAKQCLIYKDEPRLWSDTVRKNPTSFLALHNLGQYYQSIDPAEAIEYYKKASLALPSFAPSYVSWGVALARQGKISEALAKFELAKKYCPDDPGIYCNIGNAYFNMAKLDEAEANFNEALKKDADYPAAHLRMAELMLKMHRPDEALAHLRAAVKLSVAEQVHRRDEARRIDWTIGDVITPELPEYKNLLDKVLSDSGAPRER